jgi:hypothetical protein
MKLTRRVAAVGGGVVMALCMVSPAGATSAPTLHITAGPYRDGESIRLSVGPNHLFKPYAHVNILECADPKGKRSNLPVNDNTCDGNTIQGNTVLIAKNGSFSEHGYVLYGLPNSASLGESPGGQPVCNQKRECVLYIGENQSSFTWPKMFSKPFTIATSTSKKK